MARNRMTSVWDSAEELPRAGTADTNRMQRQVKLLRRYARASMVLLPIALLGVVLLASSASSQSGSAASVDVGQQAVASAAVTRWLDADPAPLPGGRLLTWDSMRVVATTKADSATGTDAATLEEHSFTVLTGTGARVQVQVLVRVAGAQVQVAGAPSLLMVEQEQTGRVDTALQWPGSEPGAPSDEVVRAVKSWAAAYTSGDPAALRQQVGDPDSSHAYLPLTGLSGAQPTVGAGAWLTTQSGHSTNRTGYMVVRLTLPLAWNGGPVDKDGKARAASTDYDLLVADAATAAPKVVAWGGPGTGPTLTPYANAVGVDAQSSGGATTAPAVVPTPTPTGTSVASATEAATEGGQG